MLSWTKARGLETRDIGSIKDLRKVYENICITKQPGTLLFPSTILPSFVVLIPFTNVTRAFQFSNCVTDWSIIICVESRGWWWMEEDLDKSLGKYMFFEYSNPSILAIQVWSWSQKDICLHHIYYFVLLPLVLKRRFDL